MKKYLMMLPAHLSRKLFGVWLIGMALSDPRSLNLSFSGYHQLLAIILIVAGVLTLLGK
jgi:hypothetical protein